jgi:hypothetical protein
MNAIGATIYSHHKAIKLAASTVICGVSLAIAIAGGLETFVFSKFKFNFDQKQNIKLGFLSPLSTINKAQFQKITFPTDEVAADAKTEIKKIFISPREAKAAQKKRSSHQHSSAQDQKNFAAFISFAEELVGENLGFDRAPGAEVSGALLSEQNNLSAGPKRIQQLDAWDILIADAQRVENEQAKVTRVVAAAPARKPLYNRQASKQALVPAVALKIDQVSSQVSAIEKNKEIITKSPAVNDEIKVATQLPEETKKIDYPPAAPVVENKPIVSGEQTPAVQPTVFTGPVLSKEDVAEKEAEKLEKNLIISSNIVAAPIAKSEPAITRQIAATDNKAKPGVTRIRGLVGIHENDYSGHFEVGFYGRRNSNGIPIGAPIAQAILGNQKTKFDLELPSRASGFLYARFIPAGKQALDIQEWNGYPHEIALAEVDGNDLVVQIPIARKSSLTTTSSAPIRDYMELQGNLVAMFSETPIALDRVKVRIRGTKYESYSDATGNFTLKVPKMNGRVLLELLKSGFMPRVEELRVSSGVTKYNIGELALANFEAVRHMAATMGLNQSSSKSVLILDVRGRDGLPLPSVGGKLSIKNEGPFFFSEKGFPQSDLSATSSNGKMIFFNVEPGFGAMRLSLLGEVMNPFVVSTVGMGDMVVKKVQFGGGERRIRGRIWNAVSGATSPAVGMKLRLYGVNESVESDETGAFELSGTRFVPGEELLIEASGEGFYNHRYSLIIPKTNDPIESLELYAFPQKYVNQLATSVELQLDSENGLLIGKAMRGEKIRIDTLMDHSRNNAAKDYYFDKKNIIQGAHSQTDPEFGTYTVFDVSAGRVLIHGKDASGEIRYSDIGFFSPSTINVILND